MAEQYIGILLDLYDTQQATAYSNLVVGIVFGAYAVFYGTSLYVLFQNGGLRRSAHPIFMLVVTTAMFVLGLIALVFNTQLSYQQFTLQFDPSGGQLWSPRRTGITMAVGATLTCMIYILSFVVCAWRAAVLWNYDRRVVAVLVFFILGTIAAAGSDLGLSLHPLFSNLSNRSSQAGSSAILSGTRSLILVLPALATNFLSALLIGIQAWRRRRTLMDYLNEKSTAIKAEKIFALVVESGFAYCCVWILYLMSAFRVFPKPGFAVMDAVLPYFAGLYPTVVVIFVVLEKTPTFAITRRRPHYGAVDPRAPLSILCNTQPGQIHTDSDMTVLASPRGALDSKDKQ